MYSTNLVIGDHLEATAVWHLGAVKFVILAIMLFSIVAERWVVGYDFHDPCLGYGSCGVIILLSSSIQRLVKHYGFTQCVPGVAFDPAADYLAYRHCADFDWSSLGPSNCWFLHTFNDGLVRRLSATEVTLHKRTFWRAWPSYACGMRHYSDCR